MLQGGMQSQAGLMNAEEGGVHHSMPLSSFQREGEN